MICEFQKLIYPAQAGLAGKDGYMVALYRPCEAVTDIEGRRLRQVKAVGYRLPIADSLRYDMKGHWSSHPSHGLQFEVENYRELVDHDRAGITAYLASGQIRGIGPALADRIYDAFGSDTLDILDRDPERLLEIRGISTAKLEKIRDSYMENRGARDVVAFLAPYGISAKRAVQFYQAYGRHAMETVRAHPYRLCEIEGIGFKTADKIALSMGVPPLSPERVDEGINHTLAQQEEQGSLCMGQQPFIDACLKTLATPGLTRQMAGVRATKMVRAGQIALYRGCVYRRKAFDAEDGTARRIRDLLSQDSFQAPGLEDEIEREEQKAGLALAPEQKEAIRTALKCPLSIITGGPGTGKTMIQKAVLDIYQRLQPGQNAVCCAPTGRAARRMEESTGRPAATVQKALLEAGAGGPGTAQIDAGLVIVDEASMLDSYLAARLFDAVKDGTRLAIIGDAEQLSPVGPGAVLGELIRSGRVPTVRLDQVFRQDAGSRIAFNAQKIRKGRKDLEFGEDFQFIESTDLERSAGLLRDAYLKEAAISGQDQVALLTPFRKKTLTGADALNLLIQDAVNPKDGRKPEAASKGRALRLGDRVMQTKNCDVASNGDTGRIIQADGKDQTLTVDFGDGRIRDYAPDELEQLDLGYASTVHKAQGSEYSTVIINIQKAHYIMLSRPLVYTAITRGRKKAILIGDKAALYMALGQAGTKKRGTNLSALIQDYTGGEGKAYGHNPTAV